MTQSKLNLKDLRKIIKEELLNEAQAKKQALHAAKAALSTAASGLLDAIEKFKEGATPSAMNAMMPHLGEIEKVLDHMTDAPGAYVSVPKAEPQKVTLKAVAS